MGNLKSQIKNPAHKRNYFLIVIFLAFIIVGVIFGYRYWQLSKKEIKLPETQKVIKPLPEEEFVEIPLEELKEGENKINSFLIKKFKPSLLCDTTDLKSLNEVKFIRYEDEMALYELICNMDNKAKVKMIGRGMYPDIEIWRDNFFIIDKNGHLFEEIGQEFIQIKIENFQHNDKTYFVIHGYSGGTAGITKHFLYKIDDKENMQFISSWGCEEELEQPPFKCKSYYEIDYVLSYKDILYLKIGKEDWIKKEFWEIGEGDILKNKFPASKIIIKDGEISFQ